MNELLVAFDIGSSRVSAAAARIDSLNVMQIVAVTSVNNYGSKNPVAMNMENIVEIIGQCKSNLENQIGSTISEAFISIAGGLCEIAGGHGSIQIVSEGGVVTESDVKNVKDSCKQIAQPTDKEIVWLDPMEYIVDNYSSIKNPLGIRGKKITLESNLFITESILVKDLIKCMELAEVKTLGIIPQPVALSSLIDNRNDKDLCIGIINIGAETIDLSIYENSRICYTNHIPLGGNSITRDILRCLNITFAEAEEIKLKYNNGFIKENEASVENQLEADEKNDYHSKYNGKMLNEIIEARAEELINFALEELNNYKSIQKFNCIYITGGGISHYENIIERFTQEIGKPLLPLKSDFTGNSNFVYFVPIGMLKVVIEDIVNMQKSKNVDILRKNNKSSKKGIMSKIKQVIEDFL